MAENSTHSRGVAAMVLLPAVVLVLTRLALLVVFANIESLDMRGWLAVMSSLEAGGNPYRDTTFLNWPPFWLGVLYLVMKVSAMTALAPSLVIRLILIAAELALLPVLSRLISKSETPERTSRILLWGVALNPVSAVLVCQHGNFDIFVSLAIAAFLLFASRSSLVFRYRAACAVGMGAFIKTVPLVLSPLLLVGVGRMQPRSRLTLALLTILPAALSLGIAFTLAPEDITAKVINYRSLPGYFGLSGLLDYYVSPLISRRILPAALLVAFGAFACWFVPRVVHRDALPPGALAAGAAFLMLCPILVGPGFGLQYIHWIYAQAVLLYAVAPSCRRVVVALYVIATVSYVPLYMLTESLGCSLCGIIVSHPLEISKIESTWLLFPLFASLCWLGAQCFVFLSKSLRST